MILSHSFAFGGTALSRNSTPIIDGNRIYYNFIKPHESLDGKTPSEQAGITIEGNNKWLSLMRIAIQNQKTKTEGA